MLIRVRSELLYQVSPNWRLFTPTFLARIVKGQTYRSTSGFTSPLQGAEVPNQLFSPLKWGRDPRSQTICLPPGYPGKGLEVRALYC